MRIGVYSFRLTKKMRMGVYSFRLTKKSQHMNK